MGVLLLHQLQQSVLDGLAGGTGLSHGKAEEVPQRICTLAALEIFASGSAGDGGGVDPQPDRQSGEPHGCKLRGFPGKKGTLGFQDGLSALPQRAAPPFQTAQQPFCLPHLLPKVRPGFRVIRLLEKPGIVTADGHPGQIVVVEYHFQLSLQFHNKDIRLDIDGGFRRLKGASRVRVQSGNDLFGRLNLLGGDAQCLGNGTVVLPAQLRQELRGDVDGCLTGALAPQLQHQTL